MEKVLKKISITVDTSKKLNILSVALDKEGKDPERIGGVVDDLILQEFENKMTPHYGGTVEKAGTFCLCGETLSGGMDKVCAERYADFKQAEDNKFSLNFLYKFMSVTDELYTGTIALFIVIDQSTGKEKPLFLPDVSSLLNTQAIIYRDQDEYWRLWTAKKETPLVLHNKKIRSLDQAIFQARAKLLEYDKLEKGEK